MSFLENLLGRHKKHEDAGHTTNIESITLFEQELEHYEKIVVPNSNEFRDYRTPADVLKQALVRLIRAEPADTLSMMRRLTTHISEGIEEAYSEYTIGMLAAATHDEQARQLIQSIVYVTRELIMGERVHLNEGWLQLIERNMIVFQFLENYGHSDQKIVEESYSGNIVSPAKEIVKVTSDQILYMLPIGHANYNVHLNAGEIQRIGFELSAELKKEVEAANGERLIIATEVVITPTLPKVDIHSSVDFFDDAIAQMSALGCCPHGYAKGMPTHFILPDMFYSLAFQVHSSDSGKTWRVAEVNVLPPSLTR